jgi:hypothetical protein
MGVEPNYSTARKPGPLCKYLNTLYSSLLTGKGGGGRGAESLDRKKAWPFINISILSNLLPSLVAVKVYLLVFIIYESGSVLFISDRYRN